MSYLCGSYLSGDAPLTDEQALDTALSSATSNKQLANYKHYYRQVAALSPAARQNLAANLQIILNKMPAKTRQTVEAMALRTATYADPRAVVGLGNPAGAVSTVAAITGIVATLGTIGLQVATTLDQRKQSKEAASEARESEKIQQQILRAQLAEQELRIADMKAKQSTNVAAGPGIAPDGSLIVPSTKPSATQIGTGVALTAAAAYLLSK